jgi:hypothetical protein
MNGKWKERVKGGLALSWFESSIKPNQYDWFSLIKDEKDYFIDNNTVDENTMSQLWKDSGEEFTNQKDRDKWEMAKQGTPLYHVMYSKTEQVGGHNKAVGYSGINIKDNAVFSGAIELIPSEQGKTMGGTHLSELLFNHKMNYIDNNHADKYFVTHFSKNKATIITDPEGMDDYISRDMFKEHIIYWPDTEIGVWVNELDLDSSIVESGIKHANAKGVPFGIRSPLGKIDEPIGEETRISAKPIESCTEWKDILRNQGGPDAPLEERMSLEDYKEWQRLCEEE